MRAYALLFIAMLFALAVPATAQADDITGGVEYGVDPAAPAELTVPGVKAKRLSNGLAAAPADAPVAVQNAVWAANTIVGKPYVYGGGHGRSFKDSGYDCSGTVSYALKGGGLLRSPLDSSSFMRWGRAKRGKWITVYTNPGHAYAVIAGLRLDTSAAGERVSSGKGPRWRSKLRRHAGFKVRHPKGL